jgi:hypothetical protein
MTRMAALLLLLMPANVSDTLAEIAASGRVVESIPSASERLNGAVLIAPGAPPSLKFRSYEASERGRFGDVGLMMDDAGH